MLSDAEETAFEQQMFDKGLDIRRDISAGILPTSPGRRLMISTVRSKS
jgi:hypothetical protein